MSFRVWERRGGLRRPAGASLLTRGGGQLGGPWGSQSQQEGVSALQSRRLGHPRVRRR